jgi:hypothetical protein
MTGEHHYTQLFRWDGVANFLLPTRLELQSFFFCGLEFELRASHLQSRHSTTWATPLVLLISPS